MRNSEHFRIFAHFRQQIESVQALRAETTVDGLPRACRCILRLVFHIFRSLKIKIFEVWGNKSALFLLKNFSAFTLYSDVMINLNHLPVPFSVL